MAARDIQTLYVGDTVVPRYDAVNIDTGESLVYEGAEFTFEEDSHVNFRKLEDADYLYCFIIDDVYGDYYQTDSVMFNMENGETYFYPED
jgi:hypothetical protein